MKLNQMTIPMKTLPLFLGAYSRPSAAADFPGPIGGRARCPQRAGRRRGEDTAPYLRRFHGLLTLFLLLAALGAVRAQETVTQTFNLRPGWNAIWLEVEPTNNAIGPLLAGLPVEVVWTYFAKDSPAQFIQDVNELPWNNPSWRRYFTPPNPKVVINNLFTLNVHRAYLVKATNACTLTLTGKPSMRPVAWTPDSLNLRGFPVYPDAPPTFDNFLAPASAHTGQPVYRLNPSGVWELVAGYYFDEDGFPVPVPGTNTITSGEAYWVYSAGGSTFTAPLALEVDGGDGLDYAESLTALSLRLRNLGTNEGGLFISSLTAGTVPLSYYVAGAAAGSHWVEFTGYFRKSLGLGESSNQRFSIRRSAFSSAHYGAVLEVADGAGTRYLLPVSADKVGVASGAGSSEGSMGARMALNASAPTENHTGLWAGNATLNAVSEANAFTSQTTTSGGNPTNQARAVFSFPGPDNDFEVVARAAGTAANGLTVFLDSRGSDAADSASAHYDWANRRLTITFNRGLTRSSTLLAALNGLTEDGFNTDYQAQPANGEGAGGFIAETTFTTDANGDGSQFNLRLLLHVEADGTTRLLKQVIQMWQDGTYTNDASGYRQVDQPGRYVLLTDDARILNFQGAALRDGEPVGRRLSCAGLDFPDQETRHPGTRRMEGTFALSGGLTTSFAIPSGFPTNPFRHQYHPDHQTGPNIVRTIQLQFYANPPPNLSAPDYGENVMAGSYREVLEGLHKRNLVVTGTFRLNRISTIGELNP